MDVLADESVDRPIVDRLRQAGHKVLYVAEIAAGLSDEDVLDQANHDGALLLTADTDFGELISRQKRIHAGVALIRLLGISACLKAEIIAQTFENRGNEMAASFTVISAGMVRIRRQP